MKGTIKAKEEISELFRTGKRVNTALVAALVCTELPERGPGGRVAFVAGKKLGCAVTRNRCKRVMREAVRACGGPWDGYRVVFIARNSRVAEVSPSQLAEAVGSIVARSIEVEG